MVDEVAEMAFHGVEYVVTARSEEGSEELWVEAEQASDGRRWAARFPARYVEEMTSKTGNFKAFAVFARMLSQALRRASDSVVVDILTAADLELLKARRGGRPPPPSRGRSAMDNGKRYLILTYVVEFDRVHYPLPLKFQEHPDPASLNATIGRLRGEVRQLQGQLTSVQRGGGGGADGGGGGGGGSDGNDVAAGGLDALVEENRRLRQMLRDQGVGVGGASDALAQSLENEVRFLKAELGRRERDLRAMMGQAKGAAGERTRREEELQKRVWKLEDERQSAADAAALAERRAAELAEDVARARAERDEALERCRRLETLAGAARPGDGRPAAAGSGSRRRGQKQRRVPSPAPVARDTAASRARRRRPSPSPPPQRRRRPGARSRPGSQRGSRTSSRNPSPARSTGSVRSARSARSAGSARSASSGPRFDPVAWVKAQERKRQIVEAQRNERRRSAILAGGGRGDSPRLSGRRSPSPAPRPRQRAPARSKSPATAAAAPAKKKRSKAPAPAPAAAKTNGKAAGGAGYFDASHEIAEIDDRLSRLQTFLRAAKTGPSSSHARRDDASEESDYEI